MKLATKHVPPRRAIRLRKIPVFVDHLQVVGFTAASACIRNYVINVVFFGVIALAGLFVASNCLAPIGAGDVARATWTSAGQHNYFNQQRGQQNFSAILSEIAHHDDGKNVATDTQNDPAQFLGEEFAATINGEQSKKNHSANKSEEYQLAIG